MGLLFLWKALLMMKFFPKYSASCSMCYTMKRKKVNFFILIFWSHGNFFWCSFSFVSFLQTYYGICSFHVLSFYICLLQISFCIYLLLALLTFFNHFHNTLLLYLVSRLCFFDNKLCYSFFVYNKKNYKTPILSNKLELFIMLIALSLLITESEFCKHFL